MDETGELVKESIGAKKNQGGFQEGTGIVGRKD
jgi:hypothetical protein